MYRAGVLQLEEIVHRIFHDVVMGVDFVARATQKSKTSIQGIRDEVVKRRRQPGSFGDDFN